MELQTVRIGCSLLLQPHHVPVSLINQLVMILFPNLVHAFSSIPVINLVRRRHYRNVRAS